MIAQGGQPLAEAAIRERLAEVLARAEFHREPSWLERALKELFDIADPIAISAGVAKLVLWLVVVALVVLLAWLIVRTTRALARETPHAAQGAPASEVSVEERVLELRRRARAARASGDLTLALRLSFFALALALGRRGDLEFHDGWTYREMLERGRVPPATRVRLEPLLVEQERKAFGREPTTERDLDELDLLWARWLAPAAQSGVAA